VSVEIKKNIIFIPDHALDKETRDNVGSLGYVAL
jgi:hypothetical protein